MQDYIDGDEFRKLCDCIWSESLPNKQKILMYADTHEYEYALRKINDNKETKFILVTHNSDHSVQSTDIPLNLVKWYSTNVEYQHEKISPIPIGLENTYWHPHKRDILKNATHTNRQRLNKAFAQFNPDTFPHERYPILEDILDSKIYADIFYCINGLGFEFYVNNLLNYQYCICPRGNGIDTHRIWESLYLGCIPIVKKHITHSFNESLPILFVDDWQQLNECFLLDHRHIGIESIDKKLLTMQYWKDKICNT